MLRQITRIQSRFSSTAVAPPTVEQERLFCMICSSMHSRALCSQISIQRCVAVPTWRPHDSGLVHQKWCVKHLSASVVEPGLSARAIHSKHPKPCLYFIGNRLGPAVWRFMCDRGPQNGSVCWTSYTRKVKLLWDQENMFCSLRHEPGAVHSIKKKFLVDFPHVDFFVL